MALLATTELKTDEAVAHVVTTCGKWPNRDMGHSMVELSCHLGCDLRGFQRLCLAIFYGAGKSKPKMIAFHMEAAGSGLNRKLLSVHLAIVHQRRMPFLNADIRTSPGLQ